MDRYTKSISMEQDENGRWYWVRAEPTIIVRNPDGTRHEEDGSDVTDEELQLLNASLLRG